MDMEFIIEDRGMPWGKARVRREGLYWHISCQCSESTRLRLITDKGERDLGLPVPMEGTFGLETRISVKALGGQPKGFALDRGEDFYPITEGEPFQMLSSVRCGKLAYREGIPGLRIYKDSSSPTGQ